MSNRITLKDKKFKVILDGMEIQTDKESQEWIIVGYAGNSQRIYYKDRYEEGNVVSPACWSSNGQSPDDNVDNPQSFACADCEHSIKGSGGINSQACRIVKRVVVILPDDYERNPYSVSLPSMTIFNKGSVYNWGFKSYINWLEARKVKMHSIVTKVFFSDDEIPKLLFRPSRTLTEQEYEYVSSLHDSDNTKKLLDIPTQFYF